MVLDMDMVDFREPFEYKTQKRKKQGKSMLQQFNVAAADFETKDGYPHVFSWTVFDKVKETYEDFHFVFGGTIEDPDMFLEANGGKRHPAFTLELLSNLLFETGNFSEGGYGKRKQPQEFYFYNIGYDASSIIKTLPVSVIERLFIGDSQILDSTTWLHEPRAKKVKIPNPFFGEVKKKGGKPDKRKRLQVWALVNPDDKGDFEFLPYNRYIEVSYLPKKHLCIEPLKYRTNGVKWGKASCWDIRPFLGGGSLNFNAKKHLGEGKLDFSQDEMALLGSLSPEGVQFTLDNWDKILEYAEKDSNLTARLAWMVVEQFESSGVRMVRPYSLASVAERSALDLCIIPTINDDIEDRLPIVSAFWTGYQGGHFESTGSGIAQAQAQDITSAYPHVMWWLPDSSSGQWVGTWSGDDEDDSRQYLDEEHSMYSLSIFEAFVSFPKGRKIYPAAKLSKTAGCLMNPREVFGFFTGDEIIEFEKQGGDVDIERWAAFIPDDRNEDAEDVENGVRYPFRPFIKKFYGEKLHQDTLKAEGSPLYDEKKREVAKTQINSLYGKTIQAIDKEGTRVSGSLFNPMYAAVITAGCRMRCAEIIRVNGYQNIISVATDGVIFEAGEDLVVPENPMPVFFDGERINLGDWENDGEGTLMMMMSGVYSMIKNGIAKSTYRGSYSMFIDRRDENGKVVQDLYGEDWVSFCDRHSDDEIIRRTEEVNPTMRPYSLGEAKVRNDYTLVNQFRVVELSISACGDSNKRNWYEKPLKFGDLLLKWWPSQTWEEIL
jgi:hypothetical protein